MKCPECSFENRVDAKYCLDCGKKLECQCPACNKSLQPGAKYCDDCGSPIPTDNSKLAKNIENVESIYSHPKGKPDRKTEPIESARKYVTALFSDLSGYTAMYYYRGDFLGLEELLSSHEKIAESVSNKELLGMFHAWQGKASKIFEETGAHIYLNQVNNELDTLK